MFGPSKRHPGGGTYVGRPPGNRRSALQAETAWVDPEPVWAQRRDGGVPMNDTNCHLCQDGVADGRELEQVTTQRSVVVCSTCLRTTARAKASRSDQRACQRLEQIAEREDQQLLGTDHVLYLMPALDNVNGNAAAKGNGRDRIPKTPPTTDR